jgi:DNA-binding SARP family transcriptional activator
MQFRVLGPIEVVGDNGPVRLGRGKRRSLLAMLVLHANEVVSPDRLIDALWVERPPAAPRTALQVLVSELRKELGAERLLTTPAGYTLVVDPAELDVASFSRLLEAGKAARTEGDPAAAERKLREALALWRGTPFQDVAYEDFTQPEIARLEELRIEAEEELVEAELACGRSGELVPKLEALTGGHPYRERLRGQLMLALYRAQRQVDALAAFQDARATLVQALGVEPSPALRRLHEAILNQDPALEAESTGAARVIRRPRLRRRKVLLIGVLGAAALAGLGAGLFVAFRGGRSQPPPLAAVPRRSVAVIDPASGRLVAAIPLEPQPLATPVQPTDVAVGYGSVWVSDAGEQTIIRIDPKTRAVVQTIGVGADVQALAVGFGSIWAADGNSAAVTRLDPRTNRVRATIPLGRTPLAPNTTFAIAAGAGSVWATGGDSLVERIDPRTNRVVERIRIADPRTLAANASFVWCGTTAGVILRISPRARRSRVKRFASIETGLERIDVRSHALWADVRNPTMEVWQYDTRTARLVSTLVAGEVVRDFAVSGDAVWVPLYREGEVIEVDPTRNEIVRRIVVRPRVSFVAVGEGAVWTVVT